MGSPRSSIPLLPSCTRSSASPAPQLLARQRLTSFTNNKLVVQSLRDPSGGKADVRDLARSSWNLQDGELDVQPVLLGAEPSTEQLGREQEWLAKQISSWLDEEWMPLDVHAGLGAAAGQARTPPWASSLLALSSRLAGASLMECLLCSWHTIY